MLRHTSRMAGKSISRGVAHENRQRIIKELYKAGPTGLTIEELVNRTGIKLQTVCARRNELGKKKAVLDSLNRRPTSSGRSAIVWILNPKVEAAMRSRLVS